MKGCEWDAIAKGHGNFFCCQLWEGEKHWTMVSAEAAPLSLDAKHGDQLQKRQVSRGPMCHQLVRPKLPAPLLSGGGGMEPRQVCAYDTHTHVLPLTVVCVQIRWGMMMAAAALAIAGCVLATGHMGDSEGEVELFNAAKRTLTPEEKKFVKQVPSLAWPINWPAYCRFPRMPSCALPAASVVFAWKRRVLRHGDGPREQSSLLLAITHPSHALPLLEFLPDTFDIWATSRLPARRIRTWSKMANLRQRRGRTTWTSSLVRCIFFHISLLIYSRPAHARFTSFCIGGDP